MNHISYDKWQAMIRLPYLTVLAFWIGQKARLYPAQLNGMLAELEAIRCRDSNSLLGQLAADSAAELISQFESFAVADVTHLPLQCERVLIAARGSMSDEEFEQFVTDHIRLALIVRQSLPWHGRLRAALGKALGKALSKDPRVQLLQALGEALSGEQRLQPQA